MIIANTYDHDEPKKMEVLCRCCREDDVNVDIRALARFQLGWEVKPVVGKLQGWLLEILHG